MRYKNTKTGNVIDVASEIKGKYWEPIKVPSASKPEPKAPAPKKEATKPAPKPAAPAPKAAPKKTTTKTKRK